MSFTSLEAKGLSKCLVDTQLDPEKLHLHVSEIAPGTRAHPPHTHGAVEAFYVLEGRGVIEHGDERLEIGPNEVLVLDARVLHGIENTGQTPMRYVVIITPA